MEQALIISDTHGLIKEVEALVNHFKGLPIFHCGDVCSDPKKAPLRHMTIVKGNNDIGYDLPDKAVVKWEGLSLFMTHGHLQNVNQSLMRLKYQALEADANLVLFGHTHMPFCTQEDGLIFINPGSLKRPRGFAIPTFVLLKKKVSEGSTELYVVFYSLKGKRVGTLSRRFKLGV
jgi:putative phosphoesterase